MPATSAPKTAGKSGPIANHHGSWCRSGWPSSAARRRLSRCPRFVGAEVLKEDVGQRARLTHLTGGLLFQISKPLAGLFWWRPLARPRWSSTARVSTLTAFGSKPARTRFRRFSSISSSPWIRGAPHFGFSLLMRRMRSRNSRSIFGRPALFRDFQLQNAVKPARCQRRMVSGWTTQGP